MTVTPTYSQTSFLTDICNHNVVSVTNKLSFGLQERKVVTVLLHATDLPNQFADFVLDYLDFCNLSASIPKQISDDYMSQFNINHKESDPLGLAAIFMLLYDNEEIFVHLLEKGASPIAAMRINPYFMHNQYLCELLAFSNGKQDLEPNYKKQSKLLEKQFSKPKNIPRFAESKSVRDLSKFIEGHPKEEKNFLKLLGYEMQHLTLPKVLSNLLEESGELALASPEIYITILDKIDKDIREMFDCEDYHEQIRGLKAKLQNLSLEDWLAVRDYNIAKEKSHRPIAKHMKPAGIHLERECIAIDKI